MPSTMTWVERVDRANPLKGELEMTGFAAILPRHNLKRESVLGGWELPLRVGSEKGSVARGNGRHREYFLGSELAKPKRAMSERCESGAGLGRMCSCLPPSLVLSQ